MTDVVTDETQRKFPLKRPEGWKPKLPRWTLKLPDNIKELAVTYIGVQAQSPETNLGPGIHAIESWVENCVSHPVVVDRFDVVSGRDQVNTRVWACYWTDRSQAHASLQALNLKNVYLNLGECKTLIGLWKESMIPDLTRFETNYSGDDYRPGLAQLAGTQQLSHELTGYWGAARDRIYASAYDDFASPETNGSSSSEGIATFDESGATHVSGTNDKTIAHIRSGQFWENCFDEERKAYEHNLEPHLRNGLDDIYKRPQDLGDYGLRFLRNVASQDALASKVTPRRETCAAGFFRSLSDLESWAKDCPSHHRIYGGSMHHRHQFGKDAKLRTWHEIAVLKPGEASWEYFNCLPGTGTLSFQPSQQVRESDERCI